MKKSWLAVLTLIFVMFVSGCAIADEECTHDVKACYVIDVNHTCVGTNQYEVLETQEACTKCKMAIGSSELCVIANTGANSTVTINTQPMPVDSTNSPTNSWFVALEFLIVITQVVGLIWFTVLNSGRSTR